MLASIAVVTLFPHAALIPIPFGYVLPVVVFIWLYLHWQKEKFSSIGFRWSDFGLKPLWVGALTGLLIFCFLNYIFFPLLNIWVHFPDEPVALYEQLKGNTGLYVFLLLMGWLVGGLYEEIVFHGFVFTQLEKLFSPKKTVWISFLLTNILFGLYHLQLGYEGAINAWLAGSAYQAIILLNKRNIWYGILAHAIFDTIALTALYLGYT